MKRFLATDKAFVQLIAGLLDVSTSKNAVSLCEFEDGFFIGGVLYDNFTGTVVHAHLYTTPGRRLSRRFLYCAFDYPFNQLGAKKIIGQVPSDNVAAIRLNYHFGFEPIVEIGGYFPKCGLMLMQMTQDQCHVLNSWPTSLKEAA